MSSSALPQTSLQLSPTIAYYIRKLLRQNLPQLRSIVAKGAALKADEFSNLDDVINSLYLNSEEINSVIHQLEHLTLSHQALTNQGRNNFGDRRSIEEQLFWLLGYKLESIEFQGNILIVGGGDERSQLLQSLAQRGYETQTANSAIATLKQVQASTPDLVLLDIAQLKEDSFALCRQISTSANQIPILFLGETEEDCVRAFGVGGADYVQKPYQLKEILIRIQSHIQRHRRCRSLLEQTTRLEQELKERRQSEERYRSIFENAVDGMFQSTLDGKYLRVNASLAKLYGYDSPKEMMSAIDDIGQQVYILPQRREEFTTCLRESGVILNFESQIRCRDGKTIWISESARAVKDKYDNLLFYEGRVKDISWRKRAELTLHHQQQLLFNIINNTDALIFVKEYLNTDGTYLLINRQFADEFQVDIDNYEGKTDCDIFSPAVAEAFRAADQQVLRQRQPIHLEEAVSHGNQTVSWLVTKFPLFNEDGRLYAVCGIATSIPDRIQPKADHKETAKILQNLQQQAQEKARLIEQIQASLQQAQTALLIQRQDANLGKLTAGIAQEINAQTRSLYGNLKSGTQYVKELLRLVDLIQQMQPALLDEATTANNTDLDFLRQDVLRMLSLVRNDTDSIQQLAQATGSFAQCDRTIKPIDLHEVIDTVLLLLSYALKNISITQYYDCLPKVKCNSGQISHALMQVMNHAIASLKTATSPMIRITTQVLDHQVSIRIVNNGIAHPLPTETSQIIAEHNGAIEYRRNQQGMEVAIVLPIPN
jgi:PAS domain S-box-containing protein